MSAFWIGFILGGMVGGVIGVVVTAVYGIVSIIGEAIQKTEKNFET